MASQARIDTRVFTRLLKFAKPYRSVLFTAIVCTVLLAFLSAARPLLIGRVLNEYAVKSSQPEKFLFWILVIFCMLIGETLLQFATTWYSNSLAQSVIRDMRIRVFAHITSFRMRYFDQTPVGSLVTRVVADLEAISEVFSSGMIEIVGDLLMLIVIVVFMFASNWQLALLTLIPVPILIVATRIFARAMRKSFNQERIQVNRLNTFVQEHLTGMNIVQLFGREKAEMSAFIGINRDHRKAHIDAVWAFSIFFPVVELLSSLSVAALIVWGALQFSGDSVPQEDMFAEIISYTMWITMMYRPIRQLADKFNVLQRGVVRAERVFEVIDTEAHTQAEGTLTNVDFQQDIVFEDLWFGYTDEKWVLKNINLTIPAGKTVAFVGATGAGKTSIINLLGRFYDFQKGSIKVGETDIREVQLDLLRKNIAVVLQDVFLFSDSVHNNITLGNPEITREQVVAAAKAVGAHRFIELLPGGYDHEVGERGGMLSVGQRQLLAFIRAYVYNPHILILDEATSSVDNESERLIQQATEQLTQGRTSIVIAHRLSTIQQADTIIVLDKGEIKEQGPHEELLKHEGLYKKLFDMQFAGT
jgi:ATP-binding cassette, subfamily B, multidrug efflux pump